MDCNSRGGNQLRAVTKWFAISVESKTFPHNSVISFTKENGRGFKVTEKQIDRYVGEGRLSLIILICDSIVFFSSFVH